MIDKIKQWFGTFFAIAFAVLGFLLFRQEKKTEQLEGVIAKEKQDKQIDSTLEKANEDKKSADSAESEYVAYWAAHKDDSSK